MQKQASTLKRLLYSDLILDKSEAKQIAYIGVMTALCIATNFLEWKFGDVQFSLTIFVSVLSGILIGPAFAAIACFLGDALGFLIHSGGFVYMPWIGISVAMMALISGLIIKIPFKFKHSVYLKLAIICLLVLLICTVGINTTGMYLYYTKVGFSAATLSRLNEHFGGKINLLSYALMRLFLIGQIYNSIFNYVLLFLAVPILSSIKPLKLRFE